jgi:hypothetical protein
MDGPKRERFFHLHAVGHVLRVVVDDSGLRPIKESVSLVWANSASGFGKGNTYLVISEVISSSTKYFKLSLSHSTAKT